MNRQLNKEQFETLKPYEAHLTRGYKGNYTFGLTKSIFDILYTVYKEMGFTRKLTSTCSVCILELTKQLGRLYFNYIDTAAKQAEIEPISMPVDCQPTTAKTSRKSSRKKSKTVK